MSKNTFLFREKYKKEIAGKVNANLKNVTLSAKGRVGFYGLLQAAGIKAGDEVIIPAFTCVVVPNAIIYCGARPVYVDILPDTYTIDPTKAAQAVTARTKIILAQNTFGLAADNDKLKEICKKHELLLIEDCTHGFGGSYKGVLNGLHADAAFYSTQWNKTFSTGFGGMTLCNNKDLAEKMQQFESRLAEVPYSKSLSIKAQLFVRKNLLTPRLYWILVKLYRLLSKQGLVSGSSSGTELSGTDFPEDYLSALSEVQAKEGIHALKKLESNLRHRKQIAEIYKTGLSNIGISPIYEPNYAEHTFIVYPFFVKDRDAFIKKAEQAQVRLNDWLNSPIHPIQADFGLWQYHYGSNPIAEKTSRHILNLPTDSDISPKEARRIVNFLKANQSDLISPDALINSIKDC